ncbi:MAG: helix-turn-helix domain-containing protein [Anaerotignum propionicum]|uniref:helix-turn-helix domain-containing protein n=1 Tax=Anaerotignum propionicum TaxID=28446 RepID=UPI002B20659A|nr:helix-turn-helix domain-containing protein [Anaerotignum propionicum]MEA5057737.1 helix-turn-helix domain-containing protein [Anaerotignum propionicum]
MSISNRVKEVRKNFKLSQAAFGEKLSVSRDVINDVENDRVTPKELFLQHLCTVFNVNENWLRDGIGEMFIETNKTFISALANEYNLDTLDEKIIECYLNLGALQRKVLKDCLRNFVDAVLSEENYEEYREEYLKNNANSVAARNGNSDKIDELAKLYDNSNGGEEK